MNEPSTPTGKRLAEGRDDRNPFVARLIAIENEAAEMEAAKCDETVQALQDCGRDLVGALDALEDMANQFAYWGRGGLHTGGLSALEHAFTVLGWEEPHYVEGRECDRPGCEAEYTTGTPTPEGYLKLCSHHYFKLRGGR